MRWFLLILLFAHLAQAEPPFRPLFNGRDLEGWEGRPDFWSVAGQTIRGESHGLTLSNTFLVWRGGKLRDFHLKLRFRLSSGNSGVQYRAQEASGWTVSGYQAEIANEPGKAGFLYEERGRKFLALLGESLSIAPSGRSSLVRRLGTRDDFLRWGYYRLGAWNDLEIVAVGPYLAHYVNGYLTAEVIDKDKDRAAAEGCLALQIHAGTPMTVEFKDLLLRNFPASTP